MAGEAVVCGSKGSVPATVSQTQLEMQARYQQLASQQGNPYNTSELALAYQLTRKAVEDNQFKGEWVPIPEKAVPQATARELTKEELRERVERKLDLEEAKITNAVDALNHGRWRQVMDEVFKDKPKGDDDGERTQEGGNDGGRPRGGDRDEDGG